MMWWKRLRARFILLLILAIALPLAALPAEAAPPVGSIVVLQDGVDAPAVAREHAARHGAAVSHVYSHALTGYAARIPAAALARLQADPRVRFVAADRPVRLLGSPKQTQSTQTLPTGINRIEGDLSSTKSGNGAGSVSGVNVAILDTGIQSDHPDLKLVGHPDLNVVGGTNCSPAAASYYDGHGHGTHVAGIVGAKDNNAGVVGVAPDVRLYAVKVLDDTGNGEWSDVVCGINWVTATRTDSDSGNDIHVVNMSLGDVGADDGNCGNTNQDPVHQAICNSVAAGVTYVVAAGNDAKDLKDFIPAAYDEVITVTAIADYDGLPGSKKRSGCLFFDRDDSAADFSNFTTVGSDDAKHTIAAPGGCIYSTDKNGTYSTKSGTSMAAPHVAGAAALCLATRATTGKCTEGPADVMADLRVDAAVQPASYGFQDDPHRVTSTGSRYYGYLLYAGGY